MSPEDKQMTTPETTAETTEPDKAPEPKSLESLLSGLDDTARAAVLGEVRTARSDAARYRTDLRTAQEKAGKYDTLVAEQQNAEQRAQAAQKAAEDRANAATGRAVRSEIKALAADGFADPDDAALYLDLASYTNDAGDIDSAGIASDLAVVLARKPHLAKGKTETTRQAPKPDPTQAAGANGQTAPINGAAELQAFFAAQLGR